MKKLENIPKKEVFNVPDGYFDQLPLNIQERVSKEKPAREPSFILRYKLQYVVPAVLLICSGIFWFTGSNQPTDVETLLAAVQTEDLVAFVNDTDLTYDLLDNVTISPGEIQGIESEIYDLGMDSEELDGLLEEFDLDTL